MTTSRVLTKTVGAIIEESLRDARIIAVEQPVLGIDFTRGLTALTNVAAFWQTQDINLWLKEEAVLPLITSQQKYLLGPDGAECADANLFFNTTLGADQSISDTVITVASSADMVAAPNILTSDPTDSTQDWDAINSATLSISNGLLITNVSSTAGGADFALATTVGQTYRVRFDYTKGTSSGCVFSVLNVSTVASTVTLTSTTTDQELTITATTAEIIFRAQNVSTVTGETSTVVNLIYVNEETGSRIGFLLTDDTRFWDFVLNINSSTSIDITNGLSGAATNKDSIFFYTTKISRPMRVLSMRYSDSITGSETPVNKWSRDQYFNQPDKGSTGTISQWYYSPQLDNGELFVWEVANSDNNILRFTYMKGALFYTETTDVLEFPSEFFIPLKWALAAEVGPQYGVKTDRQIVLEGKASQSLEDALGHDTEYSSMLIQPEFN